MAVADVPVLGTSAAFSPVFDPDVPLSGTSAAVTLDVKVERRAMRGGRKGVGTHPPAADPATYPTKNLFTLTQNQSSLSCIWRRCVFICGTCAANLHPARYSGAGNALFFTPAPPNATHETHIYERTRPTSVGRVLEERRLPTLPPGGAVPSALVSLTSLFGMGRGGSSPL